MKSPSSTLIDFALEIVADAEQLTILSGAEVLDSKWQNIETDKGIVISNAEWDFAPAANGVEKFFDALMIVGFYYRIPGTDTTTRAEARDKCFELAQAFTEAIYADQYLNERVCDVQILRLVDGMDNVNSDSFAIINLPLILNPTGNRDFNLGEAR